MSTTHPQFTARIEGSPMTIFNLIADMPNYGRWLPGSQAFGGTTKVWPYPVRLGTTYLDAGPAGQRPGSVTEYDPPKHIAFHHTMFLKQGPLTANIGVHIRYTFEPEGLATYVIRVLDLTIQIPGLLKLAEPLVVWEFRGFTYLDPAQFHKYFAADLSAEQAAFMARSQVLNAADNFKAIITTPAWRSKPSWMLAAAADRTINPDLERWYATRANSHTVEIASASHAV